MRYAAGAVGESRRFPFSDEIAQHLLADDRIDELALNGARKCSINAPIVERQIVAAVTQPIAALPPELA